MIFEAPQEEDSCFQAVKAGELNMFCVLEFQIKTDAYTLYTFRLSFRFSFTQMQFVTFAERVNTAVLVG